MKLIIFSLNAVLMFITVILSYYLAFLLSILSFYYAVFLSWWHTVMLSRCYCLKRNIFNSTGCFKKKSTLLGKPNFRHFVLGNHLSVRPQTLAARSTHEDSLLPTFGFPKSVKFFVNHSVLILISVAILSTDKGEEGFGARN